MPTYKEKGHPLTDPDMPLDTTPDVAIKQGGAENRKIGENKAVTLGRHVTSGTVVEDRTASQLPKPESMSTFRGRQNPVKRAPVVPAHGVENPETTKDQHTRKHEVMPYEKKGVYEGGLESRPNRTHTAKPEGGHHTSGGGYPMPSLLDGHAREADKAKDENFQKNRNPRSTSRQRPWKPFPTIV